MMDVFWTEEMRNLYVEESIFTKYEFIQRMFPSQVSDQHSHDSYTGRVCHGKAILRGYHHREQTRDVTSSALVVAEHAMEEYSFGRGTAS